MCLARITRAAGLATRGRRMHGTAATRAVGITHAPRRGVEMLTLSQAGTAVRPRHRRAHTHADDLRQGPLVMMLFLIIQFLDGALTYWGVTRFGIDLEMNALLSSWMYEIGPGATLLIAKGVACVCGFILYRAQYLRPLAAVAGLCLGVAVVPWTYLAASIG